MNNITLSGIINSEPKFSHEVYGERFFEFQFTTARTSGRFDTLIVVASETLLGDSTAGTELTIYGQIRTRNLHESTGNHLSIYVFARDIFPYDENEESNFVELDGYICKPSAYRQTPLGREICDVLIASNRPYGKSDYIPTIAWGRNARRVDDMEVGTHIKVLGRLQSREYLKQYGDGTCEDRVAYELSVSRIEEVGEDE